MNQGKFGPATTGRACMKSICARPDAVAKIGKFGKTHNHHTK